jgi:hypothetical protein
MMSSIGNVRPHLSMLVLASFIVSFLVARTFTTLFPTTSLITGGFHIHHFWYGLALLVAGGWFGINYNGERVDRIAALLFGSGGGLIGDEIGLLLTLGNYWEGITYIFIVIFLVLASGTILAVRYWGIIRKEFTGFTNKHGALYVGVFLATVSVAFITETDDTLITLLSGIMLMAGCVIVLAYFVRRRLLLVKTT